MTERTLAIGIDFGTDSARAIVIDTATGKTVGTGVHFYERWKDKKYCDPGNSVFRQHPKDYLEALESCVKKALKEGGNHTGEYVCGIAVDATASTPSPIDAAGKPLALSEKFSSDPDAMFYLWKDHSAKTEAQQVTDVFKNNGNQDYTRFQGTCQSEWYWAKILHAVRKNPRVASTAVTWLELCDWIPAILAGREDPFLFYRCSCAAGHKSYWRTEFGGLPDKACLSSLHPYLAEVAATYTVPKPADYKVGTLSPEWAERLNLPANIAIGGSACDAHSGAVGAGIRPNTLVKVIGTSGVDMLLGDKKLLAAHPISGNVCGQGEDSIVPGYIGMETGQAAFGDVYASLQNILLWPIQNLLPSLGILDPALLSQVQREAAKALIPNLEKAIISLPGDEPLIALDTFNGRRYPGLNENLRGGLYGLTVGTDAPQIYESLILATILGSKTIFDTYIKAGLTIDRIIAGGGISLKSPYIMQLLSNALNRPIDISGSTETCATGAAIFASVAAGRFPDIPSAQKTMCEPCVRSYAPESGKTNFTRLKEKYERFVDFAETIDPA